MPSEDFPDVLQLFYIPLWIDSMERATMVRHDEKLRAATRVIYETCYPGEDYAPFPFDEAERRGCRYYLMAVEAARLARIEFAASGEQLSLLAA